jgi:hypothetical protein
MKHITPHFILQTLLHCPREKDRKGEDGVKNQKF